jgi:molybdenum cofactor cytidylyltransferase
MSTSIRAGLSFLLKDNPLLDAVIMMVSDQPFISSVLLDDMMRKYSDSGKPVIACAYEDTMGVPALFDKSLFPALLKLEGQSGAKKIIQQFIDVTLTVPFPMGYVDIDTQEDYDAFKKIHSSN